MDNGSRELWPPGDGARTPGAGNERENSVFVLASFFGPYEKVVGEQSTILR